ncbi:MAG: M56 family metallopeptidase [Methanococcaceae archaeon]
MNQLELYLMHSFVSLTLLYAFYVLFLKKETWHQWNRFYLLLAWITSMVMPFVKLNFSETGIGKEFSVYLNPVLVNGKHAAETLHGTDFYLIFFNVYFAVCILLLLRLLMRFIQIYWLYIVNESGKLNGYTTILLEHGYSPFSFFKIIFLPKDKLTDPAIDKLLAHEEVHIRNYHSVDMLLFELLIIVQWFNPAAWLCKKEIEAQHEFAADSSLISAGLDNTEYRNILFAFTFRLSGNSITNNFNSLLKRRFEMLVRKRSAKTAKFKFLLSIPLVAVIVIFTGVTHRNIFPAITITGTQQEEQAFTVVEKMPSYPGGTEKALEFIATNVVYPESAKKEQVQGKVMVGFVVEKDGLISNVKILKGVDQRLDAEAVRVVKLMPKWTPGEQKGQKVRVQMVIPIQYKLQ